MGGKKTKEYRRLPGRKRHAFGYNTLYLGRDHLLLVSSRGMSEDYKRFYYRDIQAFITRKTAWGKINNLILGLLAAGMGLLAWYVGWADGGVVLALFAVVFLVGLLGNLLMGPTSVCHIQTEVQLEKLPSLNRIRTARRAIGRIKPLIAETQGLLEPGHLTGAKYSTAGHPPLTPQLKTVSTTYHRLLFYMILLGGLVTALDVYINHPALVLVTTVLGMATPVLAILALVRQHESTLSRRLQRVTWASLVYIGLVFLFTSISSTVVAITNPAKSNQVWELIKLRAELPMSENPWLLGLSIFFIFFAGILSALGLLFLNRAQEPEEGSDKDPGRADLTTALD